jgi:hypothetical protein
VSFQEAVNTLNTLQSNVVTLQEAKTENASQLHLKIPQTIVMIERAGMSVSRNVVLCCSVKTVGCNDKS